MQLFEESARQVRKEALHHADHLNQKLQQQLEAGLDQKADAAAVGREGQSSRKQLTDLWAEAEAAREGLDQLKGSWQQLQGQVHALHDNVVLTKVTSLQAGSVVTTALWAKSRSKVGQMYDPTIQTESESHAQCV